MEELERQKEKYNALEKTWMAANQQFMEFQVSPDRPERSEWSRDAQFCLTLIREFLEPSPNAISGTKIQSTETFTN